MAGLSRFSAQSLFDNTLNPSKRVYQNYLALHRGAVDDSSYGNEADYSGYQRQSVNSFYSEPQVGLDGEVTLVAKNGTAVIFPVSGGSSNLMTHWAVWDSPNTGEGNVLYSGSLTSPRLLEIGSAIIVRANDIVIYFI